MSGNHSITEALRNIVRAPFTRRAWAELAYVIITFPLALAAAVFIIPMLFNGVLWGASAPGVRKFGAASRLLARTLLREDVPAPQPLQRDPYVRVRTPETARLTRLVSAEGARVRPRGQDIAIMGLSASRIADLAAEDRIAIHAMRPQRTSWLRGARRDRATWQARGYFGLKLQAGAFGLVAGAGCWLGGFFFLTYPAWWELARPDTWRLPGGNHLVTLAGSFWLVPLGAFLLLAAPWLTHAATLPDRALIRGLLGPVTPALTERVRDLEQSRAHVVEDSAARLRRIERDLHDGVQAQLVALAMKLGLAKDKLTDTAPPDLTRVAQLVDDAHLSAIEAIAELRTLARGIHPTALDKGLADALATLAARSALPVELITDIPERPSAAIETIAYFSAAELLANVAKHSGARHATLEAVHVPGLLRIRVTDDGRGGAAPVPDGGLRGLAERVRTVDGRLDIDSPGGGPTVVTVELPSHA